MVVRVGAPGSDEAAHLLLAGPVPLRTDLPPPCPRSVLAGIPALPQIGHGRVDLPGTWV